MSLEKKTVPIRAVHCRCSQIETSRLTAQEHGFGRDIGPPESGAGPAELSYEEASVAGAPRVWERALAAAFVHPQQPLLIRDLRVHVLRGLPSP